MNLNSINSRLRGQLGGAIALALFAALPARADYQSTVLGQSPAGYWRLNETTQPPQNTTTTANTGSLGSSANGTYNNSPARGLPGPFAGSVAIGLDGASQSVTTPWQAGLNPNAFSVEFWVNPAQAPFQGTVSYVASSVEVNSPRSGWYMAQDNGTTFGAGSAFVVRLFNQNGTAPTIQLAAPVSLPVGSWYHIVLTYDGTTATLYENGVAVTNHTAAFVGNVDAQTSFGCRSDNAYFWPGQHAEVAMYSAALSAARVSAHYTAGTTAPGTYASTVQADSPVLYYRFVEPPDVAAANTSAAGSSLNGTYAYGTIPGQAGPRPSTYPGFEPANDSVNVPGNGPSVSVPKLNFNTNTVTITGWVKPSTSAQGVSAGIIECESGSTYAGLTMDFRGGLGLGYVWAGDPSTYTWVPSDPPNLGGNNLPPLPDSDWAYVALVVRPDQAWIYTCASNNPAGFAGATNFYTHINQAFDGTTRFGFDPNTSVNSGFAGNIDEVAIWNRALGVGDLYTQYGAAVGGLKPIIFGGLQGPTDPIAAGDPIVLSIDAGGTPPLTFTWHAHGGTVATTSSNTLVIASSGLADAGTYDVTITNASGSVQSGSVSVSVVNPSQPAIVQLMGYQSRTLYPTGTLSMAVSATGGGLKYQWYKNTSPIATATSSAYSVAHVVAADAGSYSVSITNSMGAATSGPPAVITVATITAGSYEAAILNSAGGAPEAWWRLDEAPGSTNLFDGMGRHNGVYTNASGGATLPTLGAPGALVNDPNTAASFTSAGQGIGLIPFSSSLNPSKFSIEAWVNTTVLDGQAPVSSSYGTGPAGWWVQSITASGFSGWYGDCGGGYFGNNNNANTNAAIIPGYWSHVVITYDPTANASFPYALWVNGANDGYIWGAGTYGLNGAGPFIIGARGIGSATTTTIADRFFDGKVDEVAFYGRLLTGAEIQAHYAARGTVIIPVTFTPMLSQTVTTGKPISFSTTVLGTQPISLQWYKNGSPIKDATNLTYSIASAASGDAGTYALWGTNSISTNSTSATLAVIPSVEYANVTNSLVLHLTFDGDTKDSSGRGNDGTPSTTTPPTFVPGIIGPQAIQYATVGSPVTSASYVSLGTVGSGPPTDLRFGASTSFSISLWVKLDAGAVPGDLPFIGTETNSSNNPGWVMDPAYTTGGWQWNLNDGSVNIDVNGPANSINDGNWHNFVLTVNRTAQVADSYLDGVHTANQSISSLGSIDNNNYWPIVIGQDPTFVYPEPGSATLDDIGIWKQALTPVEVAQICSAGSTAGRSFNTVAPSGGTQPDITSITVTGGTVTIMFSGAATDPSTAFTLLSSATAKTGYGPATGAVISGSAGSYTATVPINGAMQFYRIQR